MSSLWMTKKSNMKNHSNIYCYILTDLESEMYQLSHLLTEQRSLIVTLLENSLLGDKAPGLRGVEKPEIKAKFNAEVAVNLNVNNQEGRKRLTALLEKVEGCAVSFVQLLLF